MSELHDEQLTDIINRFTSCCLENLTARTEGDNDLKLFNSDIASVSSALLARQCALAIKFAEAPQIWDGHIGPLIMRTMIDCAITLRWIFLDANVRAKEFINYGLGLAKLSASYFEDHLKENPNSEPAEMMLEMKKSWISSQVLMPFVEVNIGSWHGTSVRKMCEDIGDPTFYRFSYFPFSSCAHNSWDHVSVYNAVRCDNPMHKFHYVGRYFETPIMLEMLFNAAKYFSMSIDAFDDFYSIDLKLSSPLEELAAIFDELDASEVSESEKPG